jgi:amino acid permease
MPELDKEPPVHADSAASPLHAESQDESLVPPTATPAVSSFEFDDRGQRGGHVLDGLGRASMGASIVNLTNTIVGGGILALPFAFASSGFLLGSVFLVVFGLASLLGLHLLAQCAFKLGLPSSFRKVTATALPGWSNFIDGIVAFKCFGVATSYLVVIGDTTTSLFGGQREAWVMFGACCTAPLCFMANLDGLKFTSAASLVFIVYLTLMVFVFAALAPGVRHKSIQVFNVNVTDSINATATAFVNTTSTLDSSARGSTMLAAFDGSTIANLTVLVFGFTCHQNILPVANELQHGSPRRVSFVSAASIGAAFTVYLMVAVSG